MTIKLSMLVGQVPNLPYYKLMNMTDNKIQKFNRSYLTEIELGEVEMDSIKLGSKSYPYLAVAKHYGIDYSEVLEMLSHMEEGCYPVIKAEWKMAVWNAYNNEMNRRLRNV